MSRRRALTAAILSVGLTGCALAATTPRTATADVTSTGGCTDGGGAVWQVRAVWGPVTAGKVALSGVAFTTTAPAATTVDYSVRTYNADGTQQPNLGGQDVAYDFAKGTRWLTLNPADPTSGPGRTKVTVNVGDGDDGKANCTATLLQPASASPSPSPSLSQPATPAPTTTTAAPTASPTASDPVVAAVGDVACPPTATVTSTTCQQKAVGAKIAADKPAAFLSLGDQQYDSGSTAEFKAYDAAMAPLKGITYPVPGNHEYRTANAAGYYGYFGARAGDPAKGYYSFNIGAWHLVALNSEKDITAGGAQVSWLKADLAADTSPCTLAFWHRPRWSTGAEHGDATDVQPFIDALYAGGADLVLNGHDHDYERFQPLNPQGQVDTARGITSIVSGLGGKNHYTVTGRATTAARNSSGFGYTRLTLRNGSADIAYVPAVGTYHDSASVACHGAASATPTPTPTPSIPTPPEATSATPVQPVPSVTPAVSSSASATEAPTPTEAAAVLGWGQPALRDEFDYTGAPDPLRWSLYNSAGHAGNGLRRPGQWQVNGEYARVTGTSDGTTGGMSFRPDRGSTSGRWEVRMRTWRDPAYHAVLIVWPDAGRQASPGCQEIDFSEATKALNTARFYLHHTCPNTTSTASRLLDMTAWHTYAVEWTPTKITGYIDGSQFFTDTAHAPNLRAPSHLTVQLDWFPGDGAVNSDSVMDVDWVRQYRL